MNTNTDPTPEAHSGFLADYWTLDEMGAMVGKTGRTLARWHALRVGPPRTVLGRNVLYRKDAARAWLLAQEEADLRSEA